MEDWSNAISFDIPRGIKYNSSSPTLSTKKGGVCSCRTKVHSFIHSLIRRFRTLEPLAVTTTYLLLIATLLSLAVPLVLATSASAQIPGDYIVTEYGTDTLSSITPAGVRTVIFSFAGGTRPIGVAIDGAGNYIVTEQGTDTLSSITPAGVRTVIFNFAASPIGVAIDGAGNYIVAEIGNDTLSSITPAGVRTVIFNFAGGTSPGGVAIDGAGNYIVTELGTDTLSSITPAGVRTVIATNAGTGPTGVAVVDTVTDRAVGGYTSPASEVGLLMPWLGLAALAALVASGVALVRRRGESLNH